ncbi:hypothetical protein [Deinococcus frigens]|nr:hypothetical protein [Deinococcus frigens]
MDTTQENTRNHAGMIHSGHDIRQLGRDIESLHAMQRELANSDRLEKLLKIIPRNGWTTPAEFFLVSAQIRHMADVVQGLEKAQAGLLRGADMVGRR